MSRLLRNFGFAIAGLRYFFNAERNGRIQAAIAVLVVGAGLYCKLLAMEWCLVVLCIGLVLAAEMLNTALERACEMLSADFHPMVKIIKDVAAGAVLLATIAAIIVGLIVFIPHFSGLFAR